MKKLVSILLSVLLMASVLPSDVYADEYSGESGWTVTFRQKDGKEDMNSNFTTASFQDTLGQLQPGDSAKFSVTLKNEHPRAADFYMSTDVIKSMEESAGRAIGGGGYTYTLTYTGPEGVRTLYDSDTVGGDGETGGNVGLHQAAAGLSDYGYLDNLSSGESGQLNLTVTLDGATQTNNYQDTLAQLQMQFAAVLPATAPGDHETDVVTGDDSHMEMYLGISGVSGIIVLALAIYAWVCSRREKSAEGVK